MGISIYGIFAWKSTQICPREEELAVAEHGGVSCFRAMANSGLSLTELGCVIPWWWPLGPLQCCETVEAMKRGLTV